MHPWALDPFVCYTARIVANLDTSMLGGSRSFPTTVWSDILSAGDPSSPECRARLEKLIRIYWKPAFAYIRTAWRKSVEDAKDLTQAFFVHLLDKDRLAQLKPERGSFRGFLKQAIRNCLIDLERADAARRPGDNLLSLDALPGELERLGPAAPDDTPERAYDREWFRCLFAAAIADLKDRLERDGKGRYFDVFRFYCIEPGDEPTAPTYREIAARLGIQETDVANYLHYCRTEVQQLLRERIRDYVASDEEVEGELREAAAG